MAGQYGATRTRVLRAISWFVGVILVVTLTNPGAVARAQGDLDAEFEQVRLTEQIAARDFAVGMLDSDFPASRQAAVDALLGDDAAFETYASEGLAQAQLQDLRSVLVLIASIGGQEVQQRVGELLESDDIDEIAYFIDVQWQQLQMHDDRALAWEAASAAEGSSLKQAADAALIENTADALADFAAAGMDEAIAHDARREVYALVDSPLPSVSAGASAVLQMYSDDAVEDFLRYGQYVAAAQDQELLTTKELVDLAVAQANSAERANKLAVDLADRAATASEQARKAAELSRDEAQRGFAAQQHAGFAAEQAGDFATQTARLADQAVEHAQEARVALQQTVDAVGRAAAAAAQARSAAAVASARASHAALYASDARAARVAAQQARDAAVAAKSAEQAYSHASRSAGFADRASAAARSAAAEADAAAGAASQAAAAAGVSEQAAGQAQAGAQRARAAANRARQAAEAIDGLTVRIRDLVAEAEVAAREASEHAQRSAEAADHAAWHAENAQSLADFAFDYALEAEAAAAAAGEAVDLARDAVLLSREVAEQRYTQEQEFRRAQAEDAKLLQDTRDTMRVQRELEIAELEQTVADLEAFADGKRGDPGVFADDVDFVREAAVAVAQVGDANVAGAARVALQDGSDEALMQFAAIGFFDARSLDQLNELLHVWISDPDEQVRAAAEQLLEADEDAIASFVEQELPQLQLPQLRQQTWMLRESVGEKVVQAADQALLLDTVEGYEHFLTQEYDKARWEDQVAEAYHLLDTGDKETRMAAKAAILGDRADLADFYEVGRYVSAAHDEQRRAHEASVDALLERGQFAAMVAAENAAQAREAYEYARGSAEQARVYADQAAQFAGNAQASADLAAEYVQAARLSLEFAERQQDRAHQAAQAAESDAIQAERQAVVAVGHAMQARVAAQQAQSSASSARSSAVAAGNDAAVAAQAASDAFYAAELKRLEEIRLEQELLEAGAVDQRVEEVPGLSLWDAIKLHIGDTAVELIKDILGITDVENCVRGSASACAWVAAGVVGGKFLQIGGKFLKNKRVIRKLLRKLPDIRDSMRSSFVTTKVRRSDRITAGMTRCLGGNVAASYQVPEHSGVVGRVAVHQVVIGPEGQSPGATGTFIAAKACVLRSEPIIAKYYYVRIDDLTPDELNVFIRWNKLDELTPNSVKKWSDFEGYPLPSTTELPKVIEQLQKKIDVREIKITHKHQLNDVPAEAKAPKVLPALKKSGSPRTVGQDDIHNMMAQTELLSAAPGLDARINQADTIVDRLRGIFKGSRGRPDVSITDTEGQKLARIEYDTKFSRRGPGHAHQILDTNPKANAYLVDVTGKDLPKELRAVVEQNYEGALKKAKETNSKRLWGSEAEP